MKVQVNTQKETFQPIELVITIENEQDLINLWHRFNASEVAINENTNDVFNGKMCTDTTTTVYCFIDNLAIERNLK